MKNLWNDSEAAAAVQRYGAQGVSEDLALRTYSARLLGGEPLLVLHGGGNTSVKTRARDVYGDEIEVLCVKGSGWDLGSIEPPGHPAVALEPLRRLRQLSALSDEAMVNAQRQNLLDSNAPNPSVETLLHAFMPDKFIDHTHSAAILAIADQPNAAELLAELFGDRVACVPYVMPGFALAKLASDIRDKHPNAQGLVLLKHGMFSFAPTAKESYARMIDFVSAAEAFVAQRSRPRPGGKAQASALSYAKAAPVLRGALARAAAGRAPQRWVLDRRQSAEIAVLLAHPDLNTLARRGVATPDHVIRTKAAPLLAPPADEGAAWSAALDAALAEYVAAYDAYFARQNARVGGVKKQLDPLPRVVLAPGLGLIGIGKSAADAAVNADVAEIWVKTALEADALGGYEPVNEADTFDMEYWSLEQAKLGKAAEKRLARHVVLVTGGGGALGAAIAKAFAGEGADVAVLDVDATRADSAAKAAGKGLALACDVTKADDVRAAFARVCERFGGVDIIISNAGSAITGAAAELSDEALRKSFELNFFAHQTVAQEAVRVFRAQGVGGALLFNVSKQALNPGPDFGAYGTAKAALLALVRQYALEHAADGVRVNAINPDRIRSGLLTDKMIAARAAARGVSEAAYMSGNLLGREVTAEDVGQAFVFAALMQATTGAIIPVDGGNVAAMPR